MYVNRPSPSITQTLSKTQPGYQETAGNYPYRAIFGCFKELSKKIATENESDALYLDGEVIEYSDLKTASETDLENNPVHEEYRDSNCITNVFNIHTFNL
ncbi:hypothetical protein AVEN_159438-1 [Araneus ventricosus]|uniref:Uncharacterized protein n=1 Tax=Araneus ventricosus TaxID=182803 RepID=A0A4Y2A0W2_ARAVE|nr:hypothetical protein AVEN_159438-1 [Araneus ventricosus]